MTEKRERAEHTLLLDHDNCDHEPGDGFFCNPRIEGATCQAAAGAYCRYGCEHNDHAGDGWSLCEDECDRIREEEAGDRDVPLHEVPLHPGGPHCDRGHLLTDHPCWAVVWIESSDLDCLVRYEDQPGPEQVWRGGPVIIASWYSDEFTVRYPIADDVVPA